MAHLEPSLLPELFLEASQAASPELSLAVSLLLDLSSQPEASLAVSPLAVSPLLDLLFLLAASLVMVQSLFLAVSPILTAFLLLFLAVSLTLVAFLLLSPAVFLIPVVLLLFSLLVGSPVASPVMALLSFPAVFLTLTELLVPLELLFPVSPPVLPKQRLSLSLSIPQTQMELQMDPQMAFQMTLKVDPKTALQMVLQMILSQMTPTLTRLRLNLLFLPNLLLSPPIQQTPLFRHLPL